MALECPSKALYDYVVSAGFRAKVELGAKRMLQVCTSFHSGTFL